MVDRTDFNYIRRDDSFDYNDDNRSVIIWSGFIGSKKDETIMYLVWDRVDEALYMRVSKNSLDAVAAREVGVGFDQMNTVEVLDHRIYPAFVDGAPTVAAQLSQLKGGFSKKEIPVGNTMTMSITDLNTIELTFTDQIFANSVEARELSLISLPKGYILGMTLVSAGKGYLDGEVVNLANFHGTASGVDGLCQVTATPTAVTNLSVDYGSRGYLNGGLYSTSYYTGQYNEKPAGFGSGLQVQVSTDERGEVTSLSISNGGNGYKIGEQILITKDGGNSDARATIQDVEGGIVTSVKVATWGGIIFSGSTELKYGYSETTTGEIDTRVNDNQVSGGLLYQVGDLVTLDSGDGNASAVITSVVASQTYDPSLVSDINFPTYHGTHSAQLQRIGSVDYESKKTFNLTISGFNLQYGTTYKVLATDILNLAKQSCDLEAFATTVNQPQPCAAITSITFEAYGSGLQTLTPRTQTQYNATHSNNQFMYFGTSGMSWATFSTQAEFQGVNPEIVVPEGVTPPDTVYVYYRDGAYLLPDSSWIVGMIGSETEYSESNQYVLYTLDNILNYKQLTPAGSTNVVCGTSDWGGDWGSSIQSFAITR